MIGKVIPKRKTSSFRRLNDYVVDRNASGSSDQKVLFEGTINIEGDIETATIEMEALAQENRRCKYPLMHCLLSWREGETPSHRQAQEAVEIALEELGLKRNQCVWALHQNTSNCHVHISVNRIDLVTHKAINAGGGYTHKAMERAARRIEYEQGWEVEKNAWSRFDPEDKICVDEPKTRDGALDKDISQTVKDIENITGEKSAVRVAGEKLRAMKFTSWQELHEKLAEVGMEYRKKGSGAVIFVGDTPIKASDAGKRFGMKYLEKSLGPFEEPASRSEKKPVSPEPLTAKNDCSDWREYAKFRSGYFRGRRLIRESIKKRIDEDRAALKAAHKAERDARINSRSWVGHRSEMNRLRSEIAAKHAGERLTLKEQHDRMKQQGRDAFPKLPTYEEWLRKRDKAIDAEAWRHRAEDTARSIIISAGEGALDTGKSLTDIRGFKTKDTKKGLMFCHPFTGANAFRDTGSIIRVYDRDESSMLASMQLGMAKWGCIHIAGSPDYKARCVELAVENGIKITNPELQEQYKQLLAEKRASYKLPVADKAQVEKARAEIKLYLDAVGADRIKVTATQIMPDGRRQGFMVNKKLGAPDGFTPEELDRHISRLVALESQEGRNIYLTPISDDKHHLLVDDLSRESLDKLLEDGYRPNAIIESSPGNWQTIITIPKLGTDRDREIGNAIVAKLNKEYGDPKVSGEIHAHQSPGFENRKPKHKRRDGSFPDVKLAKTNLGTCEKTAQLAREICEELVRRDTKTQQKAASVKETLPDGKGELNAVKAYQLHFLDLQKIFGHREADTGIATDYSRIDAMTAVRLRATGYRQDAVQEAIELMAPKMREVFGKDSSHSWSDYAARTTSFAFGHGGTKQMEKYAKYIDYWRELDKGIIAPKAVKPAQMAARPQRGRDVDWDR